MAGKKGDSFTWHGIQAESSSLRSETSTLQAFRQSGKQLV
jgi:hypothetical protein